MQSDGGVIYSQIKEQLPKFIPTTYPKFATFIEKYYEFLELNLLTFTDLNLNEDKPLQESANVTYTVTVATGNNAFSDEENKYYINDEVSPTLTLNPGVRYFFDLQDPTHGTHGFRFSKTPDGIHTPDGTDYTTDDRGDVLITYSTDLDNITLEAEEGILLHEDDDRVEVGLESGVEAEFWVSEDLANTTLYYYCNVHSGLGGNITISSTTSYVSQENGNTDSANTNDNYIDFENPLRQGDQFLSGEIITGSNSGAQGIVRGKYSTTQAYVEETNNGSFQVGETISGANSRVSATVNTYSRQPLNASRNLKHFHDIDKAPKGFVELFRKEFLQGMPTGMLGDKNQVLKHIKDFYRAKGNEASFQYIFRLLYGKENVTFYYPSRDMLRLSDGRWTIDKTLKIITGTANNLASFEGRQIQGQTTNVAALVERTETFQVGAVTYTELYLSGIDANNAAYDATAGANYTGFKVNEELLTTTADDDGNYALANTTGVLASISIDIGGSDYSIGQELSVSGGGGRDAKAKVGAVSDATISDFNIVDSGDGYAVGDVVTFVNEGSGGTGGAARVQTIIKTANVFTSSVLINDLISDVLSSADYGDPFDGITYTSHLSSNSTTTFSFAFSGTQPANGTFVQTAANAKFGTVVSSNSTVVIYAVGSVTRNSIGTETITAFADEDTVYIWDTSKNAAGDSVSANSYDAVLSNTGTTLAVSNTPAAVTSSTKHGVFSLTQTPVGAIRSLQVLSSGQGYTSLPVVSVSNNVSFSYGNALDKMGANSVFLSLANTIANQFSSNVIIKNSGNTATGLVLDFIDSNTSLVSTGNTVLRVQMETTTDFTAADTLTVYTNDSDLDSVGIGDFATVNVSSSATTSTIAHASHGLDAGQRVTISGASGGDASLFNKTHTIATVPNTSHYTVTLSSSASTTSHSELTLRRTISANTAYERLKMEDTETTYYITFEEAIDGASSNGYVIVENGIDESNVVYANTGITGNNAVIEIASIAIGAIQSVSIYNFGAGYTSAPTVNAAAVGGGNATLTGNLGALAEYDGYFDGTQGLLSDQGKLQDNYYYQDFSYVIKTDVDTAFYRNKIKELVHPAGMAMFGEVAMASNTATRLFANGTTNINSTQANTTQVGNTVSVPLYRTHEVEINNQNTVSSNTALTNKTSLWNLQLASELVGSLLSSELETATPEFDLVLERSSDSISLETAELTFIYENVGDILLEQDIDGRDSLLQETADYLLTEDGYVVVSEKSEAGITGLGYSKVLNEEECFILLEDNTTQEKYPNSDQFILSGVVIYGGKIVNEAEGEICLEDATTGGTGAIVSEDFEVDEDRDILIRLEEDEGYTNGQFLTEEGDVEDLGYSLILEEEGESVDADGFLNPIRLEITTSGFSPHGDIQFEHNRRNSFPLEGDIAGGDIIFEDTNSIMFEDGSSGRIKSEDYSASIANTYFLLDDNTSHLINEEYFEARLVQEFTENIITENADNIVLDSTDGTSDEGGLVLVEEESGETELFDPILLENEDSYSRSFVLFEPEKDPYYIISDDSANPFNIRMENDEDDFRIGLEDQTAGISELGYVRLEDDIVGYLIGTEPVTEKLLLATERYNYITDTHLKVEDSRQVSGFSLPMIQFPTAPTGTAWLGMGASSNIILETDTIAQLLLEDGSGNVLYETTTIAAGGKIQNEDEGEIVLDGVPDEGGKIQNEDEGEIFLDGVPSAGGSILIEGLITAGGNITFEDITGGGEIFLEDDGGVILTEDFAIDTRTGDLCLEDMDGAIITEDYDVEGGGSIVSEDYTITTGGSIVSEDFELGESDEDGDIILLEDQPVESIGTAYDYLLMERTDGFFPIYVETEDSMQDVISRESEITLYPTETDYELRLETGIGNVVYEDDGIILFPEDGIGLENSGSDTDGVILLERSITHLGNITLEDGTGVVLLENGDTLASEDEFDESKAKIIYEFLHPDDANIELEGITTSIILLENGDNLIREEAEDVYNNWFNLGLEESTLTSDADYVVNNSATSILRLEENAYNDTVLMEFGAATAMIRSETAPNDFASVFHGFQVQGTGIVQLTSGEIYELLTEGGDRFVAELGSLEPGDDPIVFLRAQYTRDSEVSGTGTVFDSDLSSLIVLESADGVLEMEQDTDDAILLIVENTNDRIFDPIVLEDDSGNLALEETQDTTSRRLVYHDIKNLLVDEEAIELEEETLMKIEDNELDNIVREDFTISEFLPNMGYEYDGTKHEGFLQTEDDDTVTFEGDVTAYLELENGWNVFHGGTVDTSPGSWVLEDKIESHILLDGAAGSSYIHLENADEDRVQSEDATFVIVAEDNIEGVFVEGDTIFDEDENVVLLEAFEIIGGKIFLEAGGQIYLEDQDGSIISEDYSAVFLQGEGGTIKAELCGADLSANTEFFNDGGRFYHFNLNGYTRSETSLSQPERDNVIGNDIVYEDETRILNEDGETTQDDNIILLEWGDRIIQEDDSSGGYILDEDGGYVVVEEALQTEEGIAFEKNDIVVLEDIFDNYKLLNFEETRFRVDTISNNTFLKVSSGETPHQILNSPIFLERAEIV